jgi:hypothetical protein
MPNEQETMTEDERRELVATLQFWVRAHPAPDRPVLRLMGRNYTPREITSEVEHGTEFGEQVVNFLAYSGLRYETTPVEIINRAVDANYEANMRRLQRSSFITQYIERVATSRRSRRE